MSHLPKLLLAWGCVAVAMFLAIGAYNRFSLPTNQDPPSCGAGYQRELKAARARRDFNEVGSLESLKPIDVKADDVGQNQVLCQIWLPSDLIFDSAMWIQDGDNPDHGHMRTNVVANGYGIVGWISSTDDYTLSLRTPANLKTNAFDSDFTRGVDIPRLNHFRRKHADPPRYLLDAVLGDVENTGELLGFDYMRARLNQLLAVVIYSAFLVMMFCCWDIYGTAIDRYADDADGIGAEFALSAQAKPGQFLYIGGLRWTVINGEFHHAGSYYDASTRYAAKPNSGYFSRKYDEWIFGWLRLAGLILASALLLAVGWGALRHTAKIPSNLGPFISLFAWACAAAAGSIGITHWQIRHARGDQNIAGAMVLDTFESRPPAQDVAEQQAHGRARLATEEEATAAASNEPPPSSIHDQKF